MFKYIVLGLHNVRDERISVCLNVRSGKYQHGGNAGAVRAGSRMEAKDGNL